MPSLKQPTLQAIVDEMRSHSQNTLDIRDLSGKVEALARLEERLSALERRPA